MKHQITRDKVGVFVQTLFDKGFEVSTYTDFLTVRQDGEKKVIYIEICDSVEAASELELAVDSALESLS